MGFERAMGARGVLGARSLRRFADWMAERGLAENTAAKYLRDAERFQRWLPRGRAVTQELVTRYAQELEEQYEPASANSMLASLARLFQALGWRLEVRTIRIQKELFREEDRVLTQEDYWALVEAAEGNERLRLLVQTLASMGLRVSEHRFVTVESLESGIVTVRNKGKRRQVPMPESLIAALRDYCAERGIEQGPIFVTRSGKPMDRSNIWKALKRLARRAQVAERKVYPHNLRHLFAVQYYAMDKNLVQLADLLGHSSIETTRIYTSVDWRSQQRLMDRMRLAGRRPAGA